MPKSPSPWSVKGVDPEAREAAKIAARKAGITVGAWLSQTIRQSAAEQLRGGGRGAQAPPEAAPRGYSGEAGQAGSGYGPAYGSYGGQPYPPQQPAPPGTSPPPAPTMQAVFESIQRLSSRIEQSEKRTADTIAPIAEKVSQLSEKIEQAKGVDGMSTAPVERAMQRIAERLDRIEERSSSTARAVQTSQDDVRRSLFGLFRRER